MRSLAFRILRPATAMTFGFLNALMLFGLAGLAIPPIIHLLNRRRYDVVDWAAMQFLQVSESIRRRLLLEEILLMLLRMGLIGVLVMGLAAPYLTGPWLGSLAKSDQRDVIVLIDGSASMSYVGTGTTPFQAAKTWTIALLDRLGPSDGLGLVVARHQPIDLLGEISRDHERVRNAVARLPEPRGGVDFPAAVQFAEQLLAKSRQPRQDIVILSDGQRFGWADDAALLRWELMARGGPEAASKRSTLWFVNLDPNRPAQPPNWSLAPIHASRGVAAVGQQVTFRTALQLFGQASYHPPHQVRLEIDGKSAGTIAAPNQAALERGQVPLSFQHRFSTPGSHLVSVIIQPDPPEDQRPAGYVVKDHLPADDRQDFAFEIVDALPVLIVDGDPQPAPRHRGTDFLRDALSPERDQTPVVRAKVIGIGAFQPHLLKSDIDTRPGTKPRVLVLADVARFTAEQRDAIDRFLAEGGGVLITLGARVDKAHYNASLHRGGSGWLPARLEDIAGNEQAADAAVSPLPSSFFHPALDLFRTTPASGLDDARFRRWWRVTTAGDTAGAPAALLTGNDPFLVERSYQAGRVMLCAVPLDNSWHSNLPNLPAFAPLVHELVYYLAGARSADVNLSPGQPIRYRPLTDESPGAMTIAPPDGPTQSADAARWPFVYETSDPGVYRVTGPNNRMVHYVVQSDPRESDLTPCSAEDRDKVAQVLPVRYIRDVADMDDAVASSDARQELWQWLLIGVLAMLLGEIWLTRRMVRGQSRLQEPARDCMA